MNKIELIAGIDDATKCPCIGSIFLAGVSADQKTIAQWKKLGVKDSKLITRQKREKLAKVIKETAASYTIHEITPAMIDNKTLNLNTWEMLVFFQTMHNLQKDTKVDYLYVDNWEVSPLLFWQRFKQAMQLECEALLNQPIDTDRLTHPIIMAEHQADEKYTVVGAASILAKVASDFQYDAYREEYGNFGSGNPGDPATRLFVWKHRKNPPPIVRQSWQTYKVLSQIDSIEEDPLALKKRKAAETAAK